MATHPQSQDGSSGDPKLTELTGKAERCRRLAAGISDKQASDVLRSMADNYERSAAQLSKEVMLLGMGSHFEIWDADALKSKEQEAISAGIPPALSDFSL